MSADSLAIATGMECDQLERKLGVATCALRKAEDILSRVQQHNMGPPGFQTHNDDALAQVRAAIATVQR